MDFFSRQMKVVGSKGQEKIRRASVMVAGMGGLGTNVSMHLVRAGMGTLHLVDNGLLDPPDLNRQILYTREDLGRPKVVLAKEKLEGLGMVSRIIAHQQRIDQDFILPDGITGVIDCMDNFPARYILDSLIVPRKIFLVHGGIHDLYGQMTTIMPGETGSLAELFSSSEGGHDGPIPVIGAVPAMVASLQALEAIKLICGLPNTLKNRLLFIDLSTYQFKTIDLG